MPPKRGTAKQEEEEQRKAEEEAMRAAEELHEMMAGGAAGGKVVPTMAMFMLMQKQMQEQMQQQEARHQAQMTVQQDQLTLLADRLAGAGVGPAGGVGGHGGGRASATCARKIEAPRLKSPEDTMLAQFRDWRERRVCSNYQDGHRMRSTRQARRATRGSSRGLEPSVVHRDTGGQRHSQLDRHRGVHERVFEGSKEPTPRSPDVSRAEPACLRIG